MIEMVKITEGSKTIKLPSNTPGIYIDLLRSSLRVNDDNACPVITMSILLNQSYHESAGILRDYGRIKGRPMCNYKILEAFDSVAFLEEIKPKAKTLKTLEEEIDSNKKYLCFVNGHCVAITNGKVQCFTRGSKRRITMLFEILD